MSQPRQDARKCFIHYKDTRDSNAVALIICLSGPVQQTGPLCEWNQEIFTHPNFQVTGNCKHISARVNIVPARRKLLSTRGTQ